MPIFFPASDGSSVFQIYTAGLSIISNTQILFDADLDFSTSTSDLEVNGMLIGVI